MTVLELIQNIKKYSLVTEDTRRIVPNSVFVCIEGEKTDGHNFALKAQEAGASVIVLSKSVEGITCDTVMCENTREVYATLCASYFDNPSKKLKMIGVTGTNGKTSITKLIKNILMALGKKTGLIGTIQIEIGDEILKTANTTPPAFELQKALALMVEGGCEYCVMEVSSHSVVQKRIFGLNFDIGVFTNLSLDHLDYHKTMENYFNAKAEFVESCGCAVINCDDSYGEKLLKRCENPKFSFSIKENTANFVAKDIRYYPNQTSFVCVTNDNLYRVKSPLIGSFGASNTMAVLAALYNTGIDFDKIVNALANSQGVVGRCEVLDTHGEDFTIIRDYAHTPDGLENIIRAFSSFKEGRIVTLFGCGGDRDASKRKIMGEISARLSDFTIITSDNPRSEDPIKIISQIEQGIKDTGANYVVIPDRLEGIRYAIKNAQPKDIIILAGKGHEDYQILADKTIPFDEKQIVEQIFNER